MKLQTMYKVIKYKLAALALIAITLINIISPTQRIGQRIKYALPHKFLDTRGSKPCNSPSLHRAADLLGIFEI